MADDAPFYSGAGPRRDKALADAEARSLGSTPPPTPTPTAPPAPASPKPEDTSVLGRIKKAIGLKDGGEPQDYRRGGQVNQGTTPTADDVPALLSKGEYVLPTDSAQAAGYDNLDRFREATHNPANNLAAPRHGRRGFK